MCALTLYHFEMLQFLFPFFAAHFKCENKKIDTTEERTCIAGIEKRRENSILKVMQ
jgi:hypothetical protein